MKKYKAQVLGGLTGFLPFGELMRSAILDMIETGVSPTDAEKTISDISWEVTGDGGFGWENYYRVLRRLHTAGAGSVSGIEREKPELTNDEIFERVRSKH